MAPHYAKDANTRRRRKRCVLQRLTSPRINENCAYSCLLEYIRCSIVFLNGMAALEEDLQMNTSLSYGTMGNSTPSSTTTSNTPNSTALPLHICTLDEGSLAGRAPQTLGNRSSSHTTLLDSSYAVKAANAFPGNAGNCAGSSMTVNFTSFVKMSPRTVRLYATIVASPPFPARTHPAASISAANQTLLQEVWYMPVPTVSRTIWQRPAAAIQSMSAKG